MRDRASLVLFIFVVLLIVILAQNGMLGSLLDSFSGTNQPLLPTVRPLVFSTPVPTAGGIQVFPPSNLPTAYAPAAFTAVPVNNNVPPAGVTATQGAPAVGVLAPGGQCVVPNGWVAYTVQAGDTLAVIAANFNLTADQLAAANCLQDPNLIYEGQVLAVPGS